MVRKTRVQLRMEGVDKEIELGLPFEFACARARNERFALCTCARGLAFAPHKRRSTQGFQGCHDFLFLFIHYCTHACQRCGVSHEREREGGVIGCLSMGNREDNIPNQVTWSSVMVIWGSGIRLPAPAGAGASPPLVLPPSSALVFEVSPSL